MNEIFQCQMCGSFGSHAKHSDSDLCDTCIEELSCNRCGQMDTLILPETQLNNNGLCRDCIGETTSCK
jgi:hypothetical protein